MDRIKISEDWMAVLIGFIVIGVVYLGLIRGIVW